MEFCSLATVFAKSRSKLSVEVCGQCFLGAARVQCLQESPQEVQVGLQERGESTRFLLLKKKPGDNLQCVSPNTNHEHG